MKIASYKVFFLIFFASFFTAGAAAHAATLSLTPSTGTFAVGSTFDASIFLDTNGKSVNAISVSLAFPSDMLQVVSPSLGQSVIGVWTAAPKFDNVHGRLDLQGGIPGGITASNALVSTITFRVKSVGSAIVKFLDGSKVLLNDGLGTNALSQSENAIYQLKLPPPAGPALASETNPDQAEWYQNRTVSFRFANDALGVQGYSYTLSDDPTTIPSDISQGVKNSVTYTDMADGIYFFHVKSLRDGVWGGTSHYSVKIDATPPADFKINISPSSTTSSTEPVIQFSTTDALSGIDHYEIKIVPLSVYKTDTLFSEVMSPYIASKLDHGDYDVIVRAFDGAHNYREVTQRLVITNAVFSLIGDSGLQIAGSTIPWAWVWVVLMIVLLAAGYGGYRAYHWHRIAHNEHVQKKLPESVADQLVELKKYRAKYGVKALVVIFGLLSLFSRNATTFAQTVSPLSSPVITTISKDITNKDIFYAGGKTDTGNETVVIYVQNLDTGAMLTETTESDSDGNWFYRHGSFLPAGTYRLWDQAKIAGELSPPGPQVEITVKRTAIQFGSSRLDYETLYLIAIFFMTIAIIGLLVFMGFHYYYGRKKRKLFLKEIATAEESIHNGFASLRKDLEEELAIVQRASLKRPLSTEEKQREKHLMGDLETLQKYIGKEFKYIENTGTHASLAG